MATLPLANCPTEQAIRLLECDVCLAKVPRLHQVWAYGLETHACDTCLGHEPEEPNNMSPLSPTQQKILIKIVESKLEIINEASSKIRSAVSDVENIRDDLQSALDDLSDDDRSSEGAERAELLEEIIAQISDGIDRLEEGTDALDQIDKIDTGQG